MCSVWGLLALIFASALGLAAGEAPEAARARAELERLRALVEAGAAPRAELERAEGELADAADASLLHRTLYGPDLTVDEAGEMLEAARRRVDRRRAELAAARKLVEEGVASQLSLGPYLEELDRARREYDLADSRARVCRELAAIAQLEAESGFESGPAARVDGFQGTASFTLEDFRRVQAAFETRFGSELPVSALGDTAVHRALGFDHRDRVDVAVHPDRPEGVWLRRYLDRERIPYFAFRGAVPGKSTGAHIHIGPASPRLGRSPLAALAGQARP